MVFAAAAMAGCSSNEIVNLNQEAIGFDNAFIENTTRSTDLATITKNTLDSFQVYGTTQGDEVGAVLVPIYDYVTVEDKDAAVDVWDWQYAIEYVQYWIPGNTYNFAAVKNADKANITLGDDLLPKTIAFASDDNTDLLYARSSADIVGLASSNPAVEFSFDHLLSKVFFTFENQITTNVSGNAYYYRISDVKITNAYKEATYTVATNSWSNHANAAEVQFGHITEEGMAEATKVGAIGSRDSATSQYARLFIPTKYGLNGDGTTPELTITCTIETLLNDAVVDVQNYTRNTNGVTFAPGHAYNFKISKGNPGDAIKFTVTDVDTWSTTGGGGSLIPVAN